MKRLTHMELAEAQGRKDWATLWEQALPLVKLVVKQLMRHGQLDPYYVRDDLMQEANLAALQALRTWNPLEAQLSTWLKVNVTGATLKFNTREANGMVGGRDAHASVVSMHGESTEADGDDEQVDAGVEASLAYDEPSEALLEPSLQAERTEQRALADRLLSGLSPEDEAMVRRVYGLGVPRETQEEFARQARMPLRSMKRGLAAALKRLARKSEKSVSLS